MSEQRIGVACRIKVHSFLKLLVTVGIGCVLGFLAVGLAICTETLKTWKNTTARGIIHDGAPHGIFRATLFHCGYSTVLILVGSCLVRLKHSLLPQQLCFVCSQCMHGHCTVFCRCNGNHCGIPGILKSLPMPQQMYHAGRCCCAGTILGTCCCGCWRLIGHGLPQWGGHSRSAQSTDPHCQVRTAALRLLLAILPAVPYLGHRKPGW